MVVKNNSNVFNWLLAIFISTIFILGHLFLSKEVFGDEINTSSANNTDIDSHVNIEVKPLPGFTPNENDDSMKIEFITPDGMVEDEEAARKNGIYKFYKSADITQVHSESVIAISFCKKKGNVQDLDSFILGNTQNLKEFFSNQKLTVGLLHLPMDVVKKFEVMGIPYQAITFLIDAGNNKPSHNCAMFYFETPDGFWSINWTAPREILEREGRERGIFLSLIKFTSIIIKRPDGNVEVHMW